MEGRKYLDEPDAPVALVEHELLVGVRLRVVLGRGLRIKRLLLVLDVHRTGSVPGACGYEVGGGVGVWGCMLEAGGLCMYGMERRVRRT
jgi:hypothetical protein